MRAMNEAKHTKGPWIVGVMGHDADMDTQIACLKENENTEQEWTAIGTSDADGFAEVIALAHPANARLIAAAPELLEACEGLTLLIENMHDLFGANPVGEWMQQKESYRLAKAAIAKAEGR